MSDWPTFLLACFSLLAAPGPTNTLMMTSGAAAGLRRSWLLPLVVALGYSLGTIALGVLIEPLLKTSHWIDAGMRLACAVFLAVMAIMLWREGSDARRKAEPVKVSRAFIATVLNPKNVVFALAIVPHLDDGRLKDAQPYLAAMFAMAVGVTLVWAAAGALARRGTQDRIDTGAMRKVGASFLALFGVLMAGSAMSAAAK